MTSFTDKASNADIVKEHIVRNFGNRAEYYNRYATIQRLAALKLADLAKSNLRNQSEADGRYIELACGTGFVTQLMCDILDCGSFEITDLSGEMLDACKRDLRNTNNLKLDFYLRDAETGLPENSFDLIINALTAQWFGDMNDVFNNWMRALKPGGMLIYSYLDNRCFPQWKEICMDAKLPFTANRLPPPIPCQFDSEEYALEFFKTEFYSETYDSPAEFFRNLKIVGAGTKTNSGSQKSFPGISKKIDEYWSELNEKIFVISYGITFGGIRKKIIGD
jgi:SAM-dependent methyltransferase